MELNKSLLLLLTHGLPILFFTYMATDVLLRNKKKTEHILLSLIAISYSLLFVEEYVRNQVSVNYSPILSSLWLSSVGFIIIGLCFHFLIKFTGLYTSWPRFLYPYIFYLPLIFVVINILTGAKLISAQEFVEGDMWNLPVYNTGYYIAMTVSIAVDALYLLPLLIAKTKSNNDEQKSIYNQLIVGVTIAIVFHIFFGYINYGEYLPPYPYLYSGIIWCYFLRRTMKKHDFLNLYDKRYEKLFNLNPSSILFIDHKGQVKDANPTAEKLLDSLHLQPEQLFALLDETLKVNILAEKEIKEYEVEISNNDVHCALLINADYVWVDNRPHVLLILQDITLQKQHQKETEFFAYHDTLTQLPNRRLFDMKLANVLIESRKNEESLCLLLIDIDNFKMLNDTYGHIAGDEVLQYLADLLRDVVEQTGIASRMGGDEYVLFIQHSPTEQQINNHIEQLQATFSHYINQRYGKLPVSISIGISKFPEDGSEAQTLIDHADQMMYETKRNRKTKALN